MIYNEIKRDFADNGKLKRLQKQPLLFHLTFSKTFIY